MILPTVLACLGQVSGFVANHGQWPGAIRFALVDQGVVTALVTSRGFATVQRTADGSRAVQVLLAPVNAPTSAFDDARGDGVRGFRSNFLRGDDPARWVRDVPAYSAVIVRDGAGPGTDLVVHDRGGGAIEYDVVVTADGGASVVDGIEFDVLGASVEPAAAGVELVTPLGPVTHRSPHAFVRTRDGGRVAIPSEISVASPSRLCLRITRAAESLVIDPTIEHGSYLGGSGFEDAVAQVVAPDGRIVVAGRSMSLDFPVTPGAVDTSYADKGDIFVAGFAPDLGGLTFATYLGGVRRDQANEIAIDSQGRIVVAGYADSPDFPTTSGAAQTVFGAVEDGVVVRLSADGSTLLYSTFLGGNDLDYVHGLGFASNGDVIVAGHTHSANFPVTPGAYDTVIGGHSIFAARLLAAGNGLVYSTYVGGNGDDHAYGLVVLSDDTPVVVGGCQPSAPLTPNAFDSVIGGTDDAYLLRLDATGSALLWATAFGGSGNTDGALDVAVGDQDHIVVTGLTTSPDLPLPPGAFDNSLGGIADAYCAVVDPIGGVLLGATYLGGDAYDAGWGVVFDPGGAPWVVGGAGAGFPVTPDAIDATVGGPSDYFATRLSPTLAQLLHSSVLGSDGTETAFAVSVTNDARLVISGNATAPALVLPASAVQATPNAAGDALVVALDVCAGSFTVVQAGCPSGIHSPSVTGSGCPMSGHPMTVNVGATVGAFGVLLVGFGNAPLSVNANCVLPIGPLSAIALPLAFSFGGTIALPTTLPPGLAAFDLAAQYVVADPTVGGGVAASPVLVIALRP